MTATVVLVHGLWGSSFQLGFLKHRLEDEGQFAVLMFSYASIAGSMSDHVKALVEFAKTQQVEELHFVGHSLGGLVILRTLELTNDLPPGRAVLLGAPVQGSKAAQGVARLLPFGKALLGGAVNEEVVPCTPREWSGRRDVGVIAGSVGMGLGRLFAQLDSDHDGSVLVEETKLPGARDSRVIHTSHTGMLFSGEVAEQVAHFLTHGIFKSETNEKQNP